MAHADIIRTLHRIEEEHHGYHSEPDIYVVGEVSEDPEDYNVTLRATDGSYVYVLLTPEGDVVSLYMLVEESPYGPVEEEIHEGLTDPEDVIRLVGTYVSKWVTEPPTGP